MTSRRKAPLLEPVELLLEPVELLLPQPAKPRAAVAISAVVTAVAGRI